MTDDFYHSQQYGCHIRNLCSDGKHGHTVKPEIYDVKRFPGNWFGVIIACTGDLEAVCERVKTLSTRPGSIAILGCG